MSEYKNDTKGVDIVAGHMTIDSPDIQSITTEIQFYKAQAANSIIEIGKRLNQAKALLQHGEWSKWLEEKVDFTERHAQNFMRIAKEYSNPQPVADLGISKALLLLSVPDSEREGFVSEKHDVGGEDKTVSEMSKRELEKIIKERDAAKQETDAVRSQLKSAMEDQRKKYDEAMEQAGERLRQSEEARKSLEDAKNEAQELVEAADEELASLRDELHKSQAANMAAASAEPDPVVLNAARKEAAEQAKKEAEEKLKKKIEKVEADKRKAEEAKAKAEQELAAQRVTQEKAEQIIAQEKKELSAQVDELRKKLAVASSSEMTIFKLHFESAQESINKMVECLSRMRDGGDAVGADKMKNALKGVLSATNSVLG